MQAAAGIKLQVVCLFALYDFVYFFREGKEERKLT